MLKPQDVLVAVRLAEVGEADRTFPRLAASLGLSASETHAAVKRAVASGLVDGVTRTVRRTALLEFLVHGLRYVFPAKRSGVTRGVPTSYAHPLSRRTFRPATFFHPSGHTRRATAVVRGSSHSTSPFPLPRFVILNSTNGSRSSMHLASEMFHPPDFGAVVRIECRR